MKPQTNIQSEFMLDTVILKMTHPSFAVVKPELFTPVLTIHSHAPGDVPMNNIRRTFIQNPSMEDKREGFYKPRLTVERRPKDDVLEYELSIELSIPKLLYGNNIQELRETDLDQVVMLLKSRLFLMGIDTEKEVIKNATVATVHFGKNILLPYPLSSTEAIRDLQKAEMGKTLDVNHRHYANGGEALYFYSSTKNFVFYDKVKDISKPKNKSMDKEKVRYEKELIENGALKGLEVLRYEIRLNRQVTIKSYLTKITKTKYDDISFKNIFKEILWKTVIVGSWEEIMSRPYNQLAFKMEMTDEEVLNALIQKKLGLKRDAHSLNKIINGFGLYSLIKKLGVKLVREKFTKEWSSKSCGNRLDEKIKQSAVALEDVPNTQAITIIDQTLRKFERVSLDPYSSPLTKYE